MMRVDVVPAAAADKLLLWNELQDYIAGMTAFVDLVPVSGAFAYPLFESYWNDANRWPFWAMVAGERAGFALVMRRQDGVVIMAEFYIRPTLRRAGIGLDFARQLLARFPATWILSEFRANQAAIAFWRRAIAGYVFTERTYVGGQGKERLEQKVIVT